MKRVLAIVVGGGPAPGINGVISAATIEALGKGIRVLGIMDGFKWLFRGDKSRVMGLTYDKVGHIHNRGGSIVGISREHPQDPEKQFRNLLETLKKLKIQFLITIGGDGTAYMAREIERRAEGLFSIVHVPKTIDNDLPLPGGVPTFGFETARHVGTEIVENLIEDARTTGKWYFITTMGRHTGHLALGIGKAAGATITLIPEEFREKKLKLAKIADTLEGSIIKKLSMGYSHGVAVLAEGIVYKLDINELSKYEFIKKDEYGNLRLSEVQLGRVMEYFVSESLWSRGIKIKIVSKNIGYELRAADPIPFDAEYTRNLGYSAVKFLLEGGSGAMITFFEGRMKPVPFRKMIDPATGKTRLRYVDIHSEPYMVARNYMIRLEKEDFSPRNLTKLARTARMNTTQFKRRFSYLV